MRVQRKELASSGANLLRVSLGRSNYLLPDTDRIARCVIQKCADLSETLPAEEFLTVLVAVADCALENARASGAGRGFRAAVHGVGDSLAFPGLRYAQVTDFPLIPLHFLPLDACNDLPITNFVFVFVRVVEDVISLVSPGEPIPVVDELGDLTSLGLCHRLDSATGVLRYEQSGTTPAARLLFHHDLHIVPEQHEKSNETIEREAGKLAASQGRHLRLIDIKQPSRVSLREPAALDDP